MRMGVEGSRGTAEGYGVTTSDCTMPDCTTTDCTTTDCTTTDCTTPDACLVGHCSIFCCCICTQESEDQHIEVTPLPEEPAFLPADSIYIHSVLEIVGCAAGCNTHGTDILA